MGGNYSKEEEELWNQEVPYLTSQQAIIHEDNFSNLAEKVVKDCKNTPNYYKIFVDYIKAKRIKDKKVPPRDKFWALLLLRHAMSKGDNKIQMYVNNFEQENSFDFSFFLSFRHIDFIVS